MTDIRIEVRAPDGRWRLALTVEQAAARHGRTKETMSVVLSRLRCEGDDCDHSGCIEKAKAGQLDGKKQLYWHRELAELMRTLPGRGANLRKDRT